MGLHNLPEELIVSIMTHLRFPLPMIGSCKYFYRLWSLNSTKAEWFVSQAIYNEEFTKIIQLDRDFDQTNLTRFWQLHAGLSVYKSIAKLLLNRRVGLYYDIRDPQRLFDMTEVEFLASVGATEAVQILLEPYFRKIRISRPRIHGKRKLSHWLSHFTDSFDKSFVGLERADYGNYFTIKNGDYMVEKHFGLPWQALRAVLLNYNNSRRELLCWLLDTFTHDELYLDDLNIADICVNISMAKDLLFVLELLLPRIAISQMDVDYLTAFITRERCNDWTLIIELLNMYDIKE